MLQRATSRHMRVSEHMGSRYDRAMIAHMRMTPEKRVPMRPMAIYPVGVEVHCNIGGGQAVRSCIGCWLDDLLATDGPQADTLDGWKGKPAWTDGNPRMALTSASLGHT